MVEYPIKIWTVCENQEQQWRLNDALDPSKNPMEFNLDLSLDISTSEVAQKISEKIKNLYQDYVYEIQALYLDDILIDADGVKLGYYVFEQEQGKIEIQAFGVDVTRARGNAGAPVVFADLRSHADMQVIPIEQVPPLYRNMKTGLAIRTYCNNKGCPANGTQSLHKVPFHSCRTATFDLMKDKQICTDCGQVLVLDSPCINSCEYKYKGEIAFSQEVVKAEEWRTVPKGKILLFNNDKDHEQIQKVGWSRLLIYVKVLDGLTCKSCKQLFEDDPNLKITARCGHSYHSDCFKYLRTRKCVVKGCNTTLSR